MAISVTRMAALWALMAADLAADHTRVTDCAVGPCDAANLDLPQAGLVAWGFLGYLAWLASF